MPGEGTGFPQQEVQVVVSCLRGVLGTQLGPLEKQQVFLTAEPYLQSLLVVFESKSLTKSEIHPFG